MWAKICASLLLIEAAVAVPVDPKAAAAAMIKKMTLDEKISLLHGKGDGYVGNTPAIPRLGIPPLNLNDGPQGFRSGGTTAFPSGLTAAASWSRDAVGAWGEAMGEEFFGKGSNVQLGPGMCVARVPRNGRNFEYLSGEDPYLGFELVQPVITGIQSKGVIANSKHWVENNQETDRSGGDEVVDERTRFEIYYPPFAGAIKAGLGSIMCSYNRINGVYSCENNSTLATDLKERLGFEGWVMSDWGATHSMSINQGLDQEMPGGRFMSDQLKQAVQGGKVTEAQLDDSVSRILTQMYKFGLFDHMSQWSGHHGDDVTSYNHSVVAREVSSAATVLLKNTKGVLPLKAGGKVALIGGDATNPTVHGGGSGSVAPTYTVSPLAAISVRNGGHVPKSGPPAGAPVNCTVLDKGFDYYIPSSAEVGRFSKWQDCCTACGDHAGDWQFFTLTKGSPGDCWCHHQQGDKRAHSDYVSGSCRSTAPTPSSTGVTTYTGSDPKAAAAAAASADVAIVFVSTSSSEGRDRPNLSFPQSQNDIVAAVAKAQPNTVVVMVNPGAVLTPWADDVAAALTMFMPGVEMGNALSDILYGDVNPSGRLPLTFPNRENEVNFTQSQYPGVKVSTGLRSTYSEKLNVGYRYYDTHQVVPKFAFGHGLSYAAFEYSALSVAGMTVSFTVKNTAAVAGAEIPQLYIGFPKAAGEPPQALRGFEKIQLAAGASVQVSFTLTSGDLSIWDAHLHAWAPVQGEFQVGVGASSRDIKLRGTLTHKTDAKTVRAWV